MNEKQTSADFFYDMQDKLYGFERTWLNKSADNPETYPRTMAKEEWLEHFLIFVELHK